MRWYVVIYEEFVTLVTVKMQKLLWGVRVHAREKMFFLEKFALSKSKIEREGKMIELRSATSGKIFLLRCRIL